MQGTQVHFGKAGLPRSEGQSKLQVHPGSGSRLGSDERTISLLEADTARHPRAHRAAPGGDGRHSGGHMGLQTLWSRLQNQHEDLPT